MEQIEEQEPQETEEEEELEEECNDDCCEEEYTGPGEQQQAEKPSKDEYKVAKWMKKNIKTKKTKFMNHNVEYFTSNKAIDALLKSKFAEGDAPLLTSREHVIEFLDLMLEHKFYHRAKKVPVTLEELRGTSGAKSSKAVKEKDEKVGIDKSVNKKDKDDRKHRGDNNTEAEAEADASGTNGNGGGGGGATGGDTTGGGGDKKEKRKRKIRLDMHPEQIFVDGSEAYVWIYDPIPLHYWIYGFILLLGAIGICLFPLWPPLLRKGVYYLSVAAAGFLVFILALTVVRLLIFSVVWVITGSKLHFWIFPNLTEDVGFLASFWPLYEKNYISDAENTKTDKRSKTKSKKKDKDSDAEDDAGAAELPLEPEKIKDIKEHDADNELRRRNVADIAAGGVVLAGDTEEESHCSGGDNSEAAEVETDEKCSRTPSESESEISGKDYEIISSSEVQNVNEN